MTSHEALVDALEIAADALRVAADELRALDLDPDTRRRAAAAARSRRYRASRSSVTRDAESVTHDLDNNPENSNGSGAPSHGSPLERGSRCDDGEPVTRDALSVTRDASRVTRDSVTPNPWHIDPPTAAEREVARERLAEIRDTHGMRGSS